MGWVQSFMLHCTHAARCKLGMHVPSYKTRLLKCILSARSGAHTFGVGELGEVGGGSARRGGFRRGPRYAAAGGLHAAARGRAPAVHLRQRRRGGERRPQGFLRLAR